MNLCNIHEVKSLLSKYDFTFSKSLGQNFLIADWVPKRIALMCGADKNSSVLEIGPGIGCLTAELCEICSNVCCVEIDRSLLPILDKTLVDINNVTIVNADILKIDIPSLCQDNFTDQNIHACANLPYYITTDAISALIDSYCFNSITVMVQKEVAQRICALCGSKAYSAFTLYVNYHTKPEILFDVPSDCFIPRPKVDSAVVRMEVRPQKCVRPQNEKLFFALIRSGFNQRRKNILNSLNRAIPNIDKHSIKNIIESCGLNCNLRAENLTLENFKDISDAFDAINT